MKLPGFRYLNFEKLANFPDKWVNVNNETFFFYFYDCTFDSCLREKKNSCNKFPKDEKLQGTTFKLTFTFLGAVYMKQLVTCFLIYLSFYYVKIAKIPA